MHPPAGQLPARLMAGALLRLRTDHGQTSLPQQSRPSSTGPRSLAPASWAFFGEVFITYSPGDGRACWAGSLRGSRPTDDDQRRRVCVYGFGAFLKSPGGFPFFNQPFPLTSPAPGGGTPPPPQPPDLRCEHEHAPRQLSVDPFCPSASPSLPVAR